MPSIFSGTEPDARLYSNTGRKGGTKHREKNPPQAILCVSAHWYVPAVGVTAMGQPRTIHDFGGFPTELFAVQYNCPGSPELAERVAELLGGDVVRDNVRWGLDHGTWSVLCHVFPEADIPVIQLSMDETQTAGWHYELATALRPLRDEGVLIMGSGNLVHNLHTYAWGAKDVEPFDWAVRFEPRRGPYGTRRSQAAYQL